MLYSVYQSTQCVIQSLYRIYVVYIKLKPKKGSVSRFEGLHQLRLASVHGRYVFKRLRFLGNKQLSQLLALLFLAVWHGLHSGYYVCFFNEFIVMKFEKDVRAFACNVLVGGLYIFLKIGG